MKVTATRELADPSGEPFFTIGFADSKQTPEERAELIKRNDLVNGDLLFPVEAELGLEVAKALKIDPKKNVYGAGFVVMRCGPKNPEKVGLVDWILDAKAP